MSPGHVAIVGAGPAGMSTAIAANKAGCKVTLLDEASRVGGQIYRRPISDVVAASFTSRAEQKRKAGLLAGFGAIASQIHYVPEAQVISAFAGPELQYVSNATTHTLRPDAVVLAAGVREKMFPFEGWTLPGILGAGGAQSILKAQMTVLGKRMVVAGAGPLPLVVAAQMLRAGVDVRALALLNSLAAFGRRPLSLLNGYEAVLDGFGYLATVLLANTQRLKRYVPIRAEGRRQLEAVTLARVDAKGRALPNTEKTIETDVLALNYGFVANAELAAMFGVEMKYGDLSGWHPKTDAFGRTSVPGVFACGDMAGLRGAFVAQSEGSIVGNAAARFCVGDRPETQIKETKTRARHQRFQKVVASSLTLPTGLWDLSLPNTTICRCEGKSKKDVLAAFDQGHLLINAVKRNTRCGMGWCGGRSCLHTVSHMATLRTQNAPPEPMTARPLARPVSLADLANAVTGEADAT